ncbi:MAG: anhydro-N-acetylmuramic acid kinase [Bacteroidales bacterium]|nr:anhydro-N-acetylmuramic acid kinase [Bacteroidales bacterium]
MEQYTAIGIMSGTSHDGLDIAHCTLYYEASSWKYRINVAETVPYSKEWKIRLLGLADKGEKAIREADKTLGNFIGQAVNKFCLKHDLNADLIASHGHTIFHEPLKKLTLQIGNGKAIAGKTGIMVVNDFRSRDVELGGQGAPLVPIGDRLLFGEFDYCLNIGGIANISFESSGGRAAFDICPVNIVLNHLAQKAAKDYDNKGKMAAAGTVIKEMLDELEHMPFYNLYGPKSLGREWVIENIFPLINRYDSYPLNELMATYTEHAALRIADAAKYSSKQKMLASGGGVYNDFLLERIRFHCAAAIILPHPTIIDFREALIFAFLGVLRLRGEINVLGTVTGSMQDHCAGTVHHP